MITLIEVSVNNAVKTFGFKKIFDGFDLEATTGEIIALIGPNGCGKTTLFKIISGEENLDQGNVSIRKGASIGLLSQISPKVSDDTTVTDILMNSFKELFEIEKDVNEAAYTGNIGMMEMFKFYEKASESEKKTMKELITAKKMKEAWDFLQKVTGVSLNPLA